MKKRSKKPSTNPNARMKRKVKSNPKTTKKPMAFGSIEPPFNGTSLISGTTASDYIYAHASYDFRAIIREFEKKMFSSPEGQPDGVWSHLRYSQSAETQTLLAAHFEEWLFNVIADFQPIKKLYWRIYPGLDYDGKMWHVATRLSVLRQVGKAARVDVRYPSQAIPDNISFGNAKGKL